MDRRVKHKHMLGLCEACGVPQGSGCGYASAALTSWCDDLLLCCAAAPVEVQGVSSPWMLTWPQAGGSTR